MRGNKNPKRPVTIFLWVCFVLFLQVSGSGAQENPPELPVPGMVTLLDFGADNCIPCKMLRPVIRDLKEKYKDRAFIDFVHVGKHRNLAKEYRIRTIPTLVFFDASGKERYRFEGFLDRYFIEKKLREMGLK